MKATTMRVARASDGGDCPERMSSRCTRAAAVALLLLAVPSRAHAAESDASDDDAKETPSEKTDDAKKAKEDSAETKKPEEKEVGENDVYGHGMQFGLRAGIMLGFKMDFRYPHSPYCKDPTTSPDSTKGPDEKTKTCGFGTPPAADIALSFAPLDGIEPYVFGRFGFSGEAETNSNPLFMIGAGARLYTMSDSRFKIFFEPAIAYEGEGGAGNANYNPPNFPIDYKSDLIFHIGIGPQYDFAKAFGIFVNTGFDVGVLRSISGVLLLNIGAQLRMP